MNLFSVRFLWLLVLLLVQAGRGHAQKTMVHGGVYDAETGEPIPFANVTYKGLTRITSYNVCYTKLLRDFFLTVFVFSQFFKGFIE